jgi:hypothetical protein
MSAQAASGELVNQLEGFEIERLPGARQQRLEVLDQRRDHQLEAVAASGIQQGVPKRLDASSLSGQYIGNLLGQQPGA